MAEITRRLGIAISDADAGRITRSHLLEIFQEAIDNGDILADGNEQYVIANVFPLLDRGLLEHSEHVAAFERRMNALALEVLEVAKARGAPTASRGTQATLPPLIVSQANAVGPVLQAYIAIHNDILAGGLVRSLRRMIPIAGIFQRIDFDEHTRRLGNLVSELQAIRDLIGVDDPPPALALPLARYCEELMHAVRSLERICKRLGGRRENPSSYTRQEYGDDLSKYEEAVVQYRSVGEDVNRAFRLFGLK